jgi:hypothetical protein
MGSWDSINHVADRSDLHGRCHHRHGAKVYGIRNPADRQLALFQEFSRIALEWAAERHANLSNANLME